MTAIKINRFGGLSPSVDPRNLADDGAQVAQSLDLRFGDFRPSRGLGASVATVPAGTKSVFRTPSGVWLSSTNDVDYVNGQIADAASERVYLTGRSAYPEAWQGGEYRRLGVPAPSIKPTATVVPVGEFDQADATAAQEAATTAVVNALLAADSQVWLGTAVPPSAAPVAVDPLYAKVQLHLRFNTESGGEFVDSSPQRRTVTKQGAVVRQTDTLGPLGASGGGGWADFTGGSLRCTYIDRKRWEADPTWTVDATIKPTQSLEWLIVNARNGGIREVTFEPTAGGDSRTLFGSDYGGGFIEIIRCRRTDGSAAAPAGQRTHIAVQNTGTGIEVYIDGQLSGSYTSVADGRYVGEHLEIHSIGKSWWTTARNFLGGMDEFRVTFARRYTANFSPPTGEYGSIVSAPGLFVAHDDPLATNLPTEDAGDAAYIVPMTLVGGTYQITDAANSYLADPALLGSQVVYNGSFYWAVPIKNWRASGLTTTLATTGATLAAVVDPADPPNTLLTADEATALATPVFGIYDAAALPLLNMVTAINSAQAELRTLLGTGSTAADVATRINLLATATAAVEAYFSGIEAAIRRVLRENASLIFGDIAQSVVTRLIENRGYIITYVTDWNEESAPSPVSELLTLDQNDHVQIVAPPPPAGRNIVGWRVYRSSTTDRGAAYQLVVDEESTSAVKLDGSFAYYDINNLSFLDTKRQEELQEPCATLTWAEPPANLKGLVGLPNGIMAGFFDKTLCLSEPYAPYAWPVEYQQTLKYPIVGLGVFGQTVVILTQGHPYFASGADSANFSAQEAEFPQSCIAKRTIASVEGGVMYASPDGLCLASPNGVEVLTHGAFSQEDWQALVNSGAFGAYSDGSYYLFTNAE